MRFFLTILVFLFSTSAQAQIDPILRDFFPGIYLSKQELLEKYTQVSDLRYEDVVNQQMVITEKDENQFNLQIYADSITFSRLYVRDTINYLLLFNADHWLIEYKSDFKECSDWHSSDVPQPIASHSIITYNSWNKPAKFETYCATKDYQWITDFYYSSSGEIDSIIKLSGTLELKPIEKIIAFDYTYHTTDENGSRIFIIDQDLDINSYLRDENGEEEYYEVAEYENIRSRSPYREVQTLRNNFKHFVYEFDSLGFILNVKAINSLRGFSSIQSGIADLPCDIEDESPVLIEFYYENGKLWHVDHTSMKMDFGKTLISTAGRMRIHYRRNKIKEILFYNNEATLLEKWTPRKGIETVIPKTKRN